MYKADIEDRQEKDLRKNISLEKQGKKIFYKIKKGNLDLNLRSLYFSIQKLLFKMIAYDYHNM